MKIFVYIVSVAVFLIASIAIIFYASGYTFNWKTKQIRKTGILAIERLSEENVRFFIDKKEVTPPKKIISDPFTSPYRFTLAPGEYDLLISKDGRLPYEERVKIEPELVTIVRSVILIPQTPTEEIMLETNAKKYAVSPDYKKIIYSEDGKNIILYDIGNKKKLAPEASKFFHGQAQNFFWDKKSEKVAITFSDNNVTPNIAYIWDTVVEKNSYFLNQKLSYTPFCENFVFSPITANEFFCTARDQLYLINIARKQTTSLDTKISFVNAYENYIYYYRDKDRQVIRFDITTQAKSVLVDKVDKEIDMAVYPASGSNYYMRNGGNLYLLSEGQPPELLDKKIGNVFMADTFYYMKDFEMWRWDKTKEEDKDGTKNGAIFITRFSSNVSNLDNYPDSDYLFYADSDSVSIIKSDGSRNTVITKKANLAKAYLVNKKEILILESHGDKIKLIAVEI